MLTLLRKTLLTLLLLLAAQAQALEAVTLQLKWTHAFQFAGYYAAQAQVARKTNALQVVHDRKGKRVMFEPHRTNCAPNCSKKA